MKITHRVPVREIGSDPITPEYQAEVDRSTAKLERAHAAALRRLEAATARAERTQRALDYGDDYDQMIVVCRGRRTTLGLMTAQDRAMMAAESAENRVKIDKADDDEQAAATADILILQTFADYESYDRHRKTQRAAS